MQHVILKKEKFDYFIKSLARQSRLIAPVSRGHNSFSFQEVHDSRDIALKYIPTILPPKKYFMPQQETFLEYDKTAGENMQGIIEYDDYILFGVHTCDLAGIQALNVVFRDPPKDINYLYKKNHIRIIGLECNDYCDAHASCALMKNHLPMGGYDLFFTDLGGYYFVHINTDSGEKIIEHSGCFDRAETSHHKQLQELRDKKKEIFTKEVDIDYSDISSLFERAYDCRVWEELGEKCLACGNCTNVCPTCYCFDIVDEVNLDLTTGRRYRVWDSCQSEPFARIAGQENLRENRSERQRHRFYRKFSYQVEKYFRYFCTGCGRCSRTCMAGIDLKETLKAIIGEVASN